MSNVYAIYDSYDDLCPYCGGACLPGAIEDPENDREVCRHCGEWVHVSEWRGTEPHVVITASDLEIVAGRHYIWLAENLKPGYWIDFVRDYTFVACVQTGIPVDEETRIKVTGWA